MTVKEYLANETILEDDYSINAGYIYLANGKIIESMIQGTVRDLRRDLIKHEGYEEPIEIRRCALIDRKKLENYGCKEEVS